MNASSCAGGGGGRAQPLLFVLLLCRGIAHGDVYAHNVMASEEGHATLCDYGALQGQ